MKIKEIIEKAIEGGWKGTPLSKDKLNIIYGNAPIQVFLLDPSFWKALGKALEWKGFRKSAGDSTWALYDLEKSIENSLVDTSWMPEWLYRQHRFIDHLAEGKSIESYFENFKL